MKVLKIISLVGIILTMSLIFALSNQPKEVSGNLSKEITKDINETIKKVSKDKENVKEVKHSDVRKAAHFSLFMLLSIFSSLFILTTNLRYKILYVLLFSLCYGFLDEFHQKFVPGRAFELKDVATDFLGSIIGILIVFLIWRKVNEKNASCSTEC